jgi:hypothetical protein
MSLHVCSPACRAALAGQVIIGFKPVLAFQFGAELA